MAEQSFRFQTIHIDAARNATDDFNLFHDKAHWQRIHNNPFQGPIVLGFQLEALVEYRLRLYRQQADETRLLRDHELRYSGYEFSFINVVRPNDALTVDVRKSRLSAGDNPTLSNRVTLRTDKGIVLTGYKRESRRPLVRPVIELSTLPALRAAPDRDDLPGSGYFLKRKYINVGNAKNFLSGSLIEQSDYFDELRDKIEFPEIFPAALISCALLERGLKERYDFERAPMVYTAHAICIDRARLAELRSNDALHLLVGQPRTDTGGKTGLAQQVYDCLGVVNDAGLLFAARISVAPLGDT